MKTLLNIVFTCALASVASQQCYAQLEQFGGRDRNNVQVQNDLLGPAAQEQQTRIGRREASDLARSSYPGRVLSVRLEGRRWRVRMDEAGTVFNVFVDADNGAVLRSSE
jgi:uncharacterized membrane protein YkoI